MLKLLACNVRYCVVSTRKRYEERFRANLAILSQVPSAVDLLALLRGAAQLAVQIPDRCIALGPTCIVPRVDGAEYASKGS